MSALSNATTLFTLAAGVSAVLPNSPLDLTGFGTYNFPLALVGAGITLGLRVVE